LFVNLSDDVKYKTLAEAQEAGASVFAYGQFVQNVIDFIIIAFCIFMMLKAINKLNRKKEEPAPEPEAPAGPTQEELLAEIRDLLKKK
jgi:large conductance mechanosensitive channel